MQRPAIEMTVATTPEPRGRLKRLAGLLAPAMALVVRISAAGLAYLMQIALARGLGAEDYGIFAWVWAFVAIGGFAGAFGFGQTSVRALARYHEDGARALAAGFVRTSLGIVGGGTLALALGSVGLLIALPALAPAPAYLAPLLLMCATVPFFALGDLAEGFARSQGWNLLALAPPYLMRQGLILIGLPGLVMLGFAPDATLAMAVALVATAMAALVQLALVLNRLHREGLVAGPPTYRVGEWRAEALPVFFGDLAQVLRQNADVLLLALFVSPAEIGIYFAATRVASLLGLIEFAVGATVGHRFARAAEAARGPALAELANGAARLTFWPTAIGALALAGAAGPILSLFGADYAGAAPLVLWLAAGHAFRAIIGPAEDLIITRGAGAATFHAQLAGLVVAAGGVVCLVPLFGLAGAAMAAFASMAATTLVLALACRRHIGFWPCGLCLTFASRHGDH
jgi:O-antigen/teichoic acid export membrane protein